MLVYLLLPALLLGDVELQRLNVTEEQLNTTFAATPPSAATPGPSGEPRTASEDGLQRNQSWVFVAEEDEGFQDQVIPFQWQYCHWDLLVPLSNTCRAAFHADMVALGADRRCVLHNVIRSYSQLTSCLEDAHHWLGCFFPSADVQDFFLDVHAAYFHGCARAEDGALEDVPRGTLAVLTLAPIALLPLLVYLVGWRSKVAP